MILEFYLRDRADAKIDPLGEYPLRAKIILIAICSCDRQSGKNTKGKKTRIAVTCHESTWIEYDHRTNTCVRNSTGKNLCRKIKLQRMSKEHE